VSIPERSPKQVYGAMTDVLERALAEAARAQWAGQQADLHRARRALIDARREVPNDRSDPVAQIVRDLLTAYAAVLDEQSRRTSYERDAALSAELRDELARLRPRAARQGLPVLTDDLRGFRMGRGADSPRPRRPVEERPPAPQAKPPAARRRRRRSARNAS
jgi:hypothetical protein